MSLVLYVFRSGPGLKFESFSISIWLEIRIAGTFSHPARVGPWLSTIRADPNFSVPPINSYLPQDSRDSRVLCCGANSATCRARVASCYAPAVPCTLPRVRALSFDGEYPDSITRGEAGFRLACIELWAGNAKLRISDGQEKDTLGIVPPLGRPPLAYSTTSSKDWRAAN